jgi:hypothetical protein
VGYQPWLDADPESTLIKFNASADSYGKYVEAMKKFVGKYNETNGMDYGIMR